MTAINHALTGAAIGFISGHPILAVPAALGSHFICDALPHYKRAMPEKQLLRSSWFRNYLFVEAGLCVGLVLLLFALHPDHWLLAAICAFTAAAPDLLSINKFRQMRQGKKWRPGWYVKFAGAIQWFERPIGGAVEIAWFIAAVAILAPFLAR